MMTAKFLSTCIGSFIGSSILSAQSTAASHMEQFGSLNVMNMVRQLEQNALLVLAGAVILMGIGWICSIWKACVGLNQPSKKIRIPSVTLLILGMGLSVFCGSCSMEQRAMAARYRAAAEGRTGPCPHESINHARMPHNNRYPSTVYSNLYGPSFCKFCGQRISR